MVSPDSSTEGSGSESESSMDEREKRFYSRPAPSRPPPPSSSLSQSESESQSDSSEHIATVQQKKTPVSTAAASSKTPSSSVKRPRNEADDERTNKKSKKPKPTKEEPKTNADKKRVKKAEQIPLPSPQKSGKKQVIFWNPKDELNFLKALASYIQDGKEFPQKVMTPVYEHVRSLNVLSQDYNTRQLGEKFRSLRSKFDKVKSGGHSFKTAYDEMVFKFSRRIWGREEEEEASEYESEKSEEKSMKQAEVGNGTQEESVVKKVGQDVEEDAEEDKKDAEEDKKDTEEEENKSISEDLQMTQMTQKQNHEVEEDETTATPHGHSNGGIISNGVHSSKEAVHNNNSGELIEQIRKENSAVMNEIKAELMREFTEIKSVLVNTVRDILHRYGNGEASNRVGFSIEEVANKIHPPRLLALNVSEARELEQKWERQERAELEVSVGHFALLQEECQKRLEKLGPRLDQKTERDIERTQ